MKLKYGSLVTLSALASLLTPNVYSATFEKIKVTRGYDMALSKVPLDVRARVFGLESNSELSLRNKGTDHNGNYHERLQQTYRGIPIWGKHITIHEDSTGKVKRVVGKAATGLSNDLLDAYKLKKKGNKFYLDILKNANNGAGDADIVYKNEKVSPYIYVAEDTGVAEFVVEVSYFSYNNSTNTPSSPRALIKADSGEIIKQWEGIKTYFAYGRGPGMNKKVEASLGYQISYGAIPIDKSGDVCTMADIGKRIYTVDGKNSSSYVPSTSTSKAFTYQCGKYNENTYKTVNGGYSPINDIQFWASKTDAMFRAYIGSSPLVGENLLLVAHYRSSFQNAFWDDDSGSLYFGDGASTFYPLTSLDVVGHEIGHGFTSQHSDLVYSEQSGAINEAFSDLAGEAAEYYHKINNPYNPKPNDWLVGSEITKKTTALRYMNNPPLDGHSIDNYKNWKSGMSVHYASGIYNKAFYLLATTSGWNTQKVFQVAAHANMYYWTPTTALRHSGGCGLMYSAEDLHYSVVQVEQALNQVGLYPYCDD